MSRKAQDAKQIWIHKDIHAAYKKLAPLIRHNLREAIEVALIAQLPELQEKALNMGQALEQGPTEDV